MPRRGLKIAAVTLALMVLGLLLALPVAFQFVPRHGGPCHDVGMGLQQMVSGARAHYLGGQWDKDGELLPNSFPTGIQKTPARVRCGDDAVVSNKAWTAGGWGPLGFPGSFSRPRAHCTHEFQAMGVGAAATYTARITCQYTCGDVLRVMEAAGWIDREGSVKTRNRWVNCTWTRTERVVRRILHTVTFGHVDYPDVLEFGDRPKANR